MIIYGTKAVHLNSARAESVLCTNCSTKGSIIISVFRQHAHIFWIPLFPIGKKGVSQCANCKNTYTSSEMPQSIKAEYNKIKGDVKGPIWQFAGLVIIAIVVALGNYRSGENEKLNEVYLNEPQVGDVYEYKVENGNYSTYKVIEVVQDSVYVSPNEYEITKSSKLYKIDKEENYADFYYAFSKQEIKDMYSSKEIMDINRD